MPGAAAGKLVRANGAGHHPRFANGWAKHLTSTTGYWVKTRTALRRRVTAYVVGEELARRVQTSYRLKQGFDAATLIQLGGNMKPSTHDQVEGKFQEVKGKMKEKAGQVTNNPDLAAEGQADKVAGKVQKKVGQIEKVFEK
jgi:uncharacterized protein YjbJ (UPF0337 family)